LNIETDVIMATRRPTDHYQCLKFDFAPIWLAHQVQPKWIVGQAY